eukprot:TRINITY_DN1301_c0_g1_i2.p2 TRINITY_DN1301_c0_g1~~TRINITY_DN1301_c0_g1_i2.p2  ORF type:complete len:138 (+),score=28.92 TRINITY_DN1301_c0_g1_i2:37-450(+)
MPTLKDVSAQDIIAALAVVLKNKGLEIKGDLTIIKTAVRKELPPTDVDFIFVRAAAILRALYIRPGQGVGALTRYFGGAKNNGTCKSHFSRSAAGIIRRILLATDKLGFTSKKASGRALTKSGVQLLDTVANSVLAQ